MKLSRLFSFLALMVASFRPAIADSNSYTVVGRAYSVTTETVLDDRLPAGTTTKYFDQKVQKPSGAFEDIVQICVPGFDPTNCTAAYLLGSCTKSTYNYGPKFPDDHRTIFGTIVTCSPVNTGRCASSAGHLVSKDLPVVDLVSVGFGCQF